VGSQFQRCQWKEQFGCVYYVPFFSLAKSTSHSLPLPFEYRFSCSFSLLFSLLIRLRILIMIFRLFCYPASAPLDFLRFELTLPISTGWGASTPSTLAQILKNLAPSQHLRVFLGPSLPTSPKDPSYIAWDPTFIRWHNLPPGLESCVQSWLTPSGWKSGAPKTMTWNTKGSCFAVSEYDAVVIGMGEKEIGDDDTPFMDTVKEWGEEPDFQWKDVAYLNLDPGNSDQFIAIRHDGTWAGSIDADANEEALEAFAHNFFSRPKPAKAREPSPQTRPKAKSQPSPRPAQPPQQNHNRPQSNTYNNNRSNQHNPNNPNYRSGNTNGAHIPPPQIPTPTPTPIPPIPDAQSQALYNRWATETATMLASALAANNAPSPSATPSTTSKSRSRPPKKIQIRSSSTSIPTTSVGQLMTSFPYLPPSLTVCIVPVCVLYKRDPGGLRACKHDVERLLKASGLYSREWLKQERIRWHPDRFGRLCDVGFREEGRKLSEEMFKAVDALLVEEAAR
jgi:hypothetical protein